MSEKPFDIQKQEIFDGIVTPKKRLYTTLILTRSALRYKVEKDHISLIGIHHFDSRFLSNALIQHYDNIIFIDDDKQILVMKAREVPYGIYDYSWLNALINV